MAAGSIYGIFSKVEGVSKVEKKYKFPVIFEKDKDGYFAFCPLFQGCYTQGDTYKEARKNIQEAITAHVRESLAKGEDHEH